MNLLIVDDEYYIIHSIATNLNTERLGLDNVFSAYSAEQAKRIIEKEAVDILLTDIEMPHGSGLQLIEWIQQNEYSIIPLILTGHQRFDYAHKAITMQCFSYILKPVQMDLLEQELLKAMAHVKHYDEPRNEEADVNKPLKEIKDTTVSDDFVPKVQAYILENLSSEELCRASIAEYVHINPDYLSYLFHSKFNCTLISYITSVRIDKAKELLLHTDMSLLEISDHVGFSSASYFFKQFKKQTGLTAQQYRYRKNG